MHFRNTHLLSLLARWTLIVVLVTLLCMAMYIYQLKHRFTVDEENIPLPFGSENILLGAISKIGSKGGMDIHHVTFERAEQEEVLPEGDMSILTLSQDLDIDHRANLGAVLTPGKRIMGYKYMTRSGSNEKGRSDRAAQGEPIPFSEIFAGQFFASDERRNDGTNDVQGLESLHGITFLPLASVALERDARYVIVTKSPDTRITPRNSHRCGDKKVEGSEQCDEGIWNGVVCAPRYGASCSYCSSTCSIHTEQAPRCGDGTKSGFEQCDSGDAVYGDGCSGRWCLFESTPRIECLSRIVAWNEVIFNPPVAAQSAQSFVEALRGWARSKVESMFFDRDSIYLVRNTGKPAVLKVHPIAAVANTYNFEDMAGVGNGAWNERVATYLAHDPVRHLLYTSFYSNNPNDRPPEANNEGPPHSWVMIVDTDTMKKEKVVITPRDWPLIHHGGGEQYGLGAVDSDRGYVFAAGISRSNATPSLLMMTPEGNPLGVRFIDHETLTDVQGTYYITDVVTNPLRGHVYVLLAAQVGNTQKVVKLSYTSDGLTILSTKDLDSTHFGRRGIISQDGSKLYLIGGVWSFAVDGYVPENVVEIDEDTLEPLRQVELANKGASLDPPRITSVFPAWNDDSLVLKFSSSITLQNDRSKFVRIPLSTFTPQVQHFYLPDEAGNEDMLYGPFIVPRYGEGWLIAVSEKQQNTSVDGGVVTRIPLQFAHIPLPADCGQLFLPPGGM